MAGEAEKNVMTASRLREYMRELETLRLVDRKEVNDRLRAARSPGDLSQNREYDEAKREQTRIENRIGELEEILRRAMTEN